MNRIYWLNINKYRPVNNQEVLLRIIYKTGKRIFQCAVYNKSFEGFISSDKGETYMATKLNPDIASIHYLPIDCLTGEGVEEFN